MSLKSIAQRAVGKPSLSPRATSLPTEDGANSGTDIAHVNIVLLPLLIGGFFAAGGKGHNANALAPVLLWCIAVLSAGAMIGFLFGIPRSGLNRRPEKAQGETGSDPLISSDESANTRPNTNLEEVSDWLTKIIVGLTLVNLTSIQTEIKLISITMAASVSVQAVPNASDVSFATALVVGFFILGFFCGYLYTRLFLPGAFARSNKAGFLVHYMQVVQEEWQNLQPAPVDDDAGGLPTLEEVQSAHRVLQATPIDQPLAALRPMQELAAEYQRVRASMPAGRERTRAMSEVARRMATVALAAAPSISQLANSTSPGERLAAVVILKVQFDTKYIDWLSNRLVEELPFVGYQAATALLVGVRLLGEAEKGRIKDAVEVAKQQLQAKQLFDSARDKLIDEILAS